MRTELKRKRGIQKYGCAGGALRIRNVDYTRCDQFLPTKASMDIQPSPDPKSEFSAVTGSSNKNKTKISSECCVRNFVSLLQYESDGCVRGLV